MADTPRRILSQLDLAGLAPLQLALEPRASAPEAPGPGRIYYDTTLELVRIYDGTQWRSIGEGGSGGPHDHDARYYTESEVDALVAAADAHHRHVQATPAAVWVVNHGLGKHPTVAAVDSAGRVVIGDVSYDTLDRLTLRFGAPFGGEAYCN